MIKSNTYNSITSRLAVDAGADMEQLIIDSRDALGELEYIECMGNLHYYRKEYQKAALLYEQAMKRSPDYDCARYHYIVGLQDESVGALTDAFDRYQAAIEIEPEFIDTYIELGALLCKVGDYKGAYQCYTDAILLDPKSMAIRHNQLQVLLCLSKKDPGAYSEAFKIAHAEYDALKD